MNSHAALQATFINRAAGAEYTSLPGASSLTYNTDMRLFTDSFDFEVKFGRKQSVQINSHDFVEFYFLLDGVKFQVGVGFVETFKQHATADGYVFQGNGRDLLGQLIDIPFKEQLHWPGLTMKSFLPKALSNSAYVYEYLNFRNRSIEIVDRGAYPSGMLFTSTAMVNRGAVIEEYAELAMNRVYLDRLGRVTVYGRANVADLVVNETISHEGDLNTLDLVKTDDYSKVYSEVTIFVAEGEANLDLSKISSPLYKNTDPRVAHLYRPYYKTMSSSDLVKLGGVGVRSLQDRVAKSTIRKANQNIGSVQVRMAVPYYVNLSGTKIPYEIGQNWNLKSDAFGINNQMKLIGIGYRQEAHSLDVQLAFVEPDTVV